VSPVLRLSRTWTQALCARAKALPPLPDGLHGGGVVEEDDGGGREGGLADAEGQLLQSADHGGEEQDAQRQQQQFLKALPPGDALVDQLQEAQGAERHDLRLPPMHQVQDDRYQ